MMAVLRSLPWRLLAALSIGCIAACSGDGSRCAALPGGARYCLQSTAAMAPFDAQQSVEITFDGRSETMIAQLEVDAEGMRFVLTTPFGQKLMQMEFDNARVKVEAPSLPGLDPLVLLALMQIAAWPVDSVRMGLSGSAQLVEAPGIDAQHVDVPLVEAPQMRALARDGVGLVTITYTRGRPPLADQLIALPALGVALSIVNLDVARAP